MIIMVLVRHFQHNAHQFLNMNNGICYPQAAHIRGS